MKSSSPVPEHFNGFFMVEESSFNKTRGDEDIEGKGGSEKFYIPVEGGTEKIVGLGKGF